MDPKEEPMKINRGKKRQNTRPAYLDDERALAKDLYARRDDPAAASEKPIKIESQPTGWQAVSFRLPTNELRLVLKAAKMAGESLSHYVRGALAYRMGRELFVSPIEWTYGILGAQGRVGLFSSKGVWFERTHNIDTRSNVAIVQKAS